MRFKRKLYHTDDHRIRRRFLLFPYIIGTETRWLEFAEWEQRFIARNPYNLLSDGYWIDLKWLD